jgi:hypothetical protein
MFAPVLVGSCSVAPSPVLRNQPRRPTEIADEA